MTDSENEPEDKMSHLALHRRIKKIEILVAAFVALLATLGYEIL